MPMFTGAYKAPHLVEADQMDDDDMMQRLLQMMMQRGDKREEQQQDQTRRRMAALVGVPQSARIEDQMRREKRKDLANDALPGNVVEAHIRGGAPRPSNATLQAAGISPEELERRREEGNERRRDRFRKQREEKLERGTHGTATIGNKSFGGEKMTDQERRQLKRQINDLRAMLGMESY